MSVEVDVEYCGSCGYVRKFEELSQKIAQNNPAAKVIGKEGRQASFEVTINGSLVHSKLLTMAFPDFHDVSDIITDVSEGNEVVRTAKQQPITDCTVM